MTYVNPITVMISRQEAPEVYDMNASIYVYTRDYIMEPSNKSPIADWTRIYIMEDWQAFDIDSELDFKIVEFLMREKVNKRM